jgi:hypothetical protein
MELLESTNSNKNNKTMTPDNNKIKAHTPIKTVSEVSDIKYTITKNNIKAHKIDQ